MGVVWGVSGFVGMMCGSGGGRLAQLQKGESDVEQKSVVVRESDVQQRREKDEMDGLILSAVNGTTEKQRQNRRSRIKIRLMFISFKMKWNCPRKTVVPLCVNTSFRTGF